MCQRALCNATFSNHAKRRNVEGVIRYTTGQLQASASKALAAGRSS